MARALISLLSGSLFGLGLAISQMTNPLKVLNFLDVAGNWDPGLALVMGGALFVAAIGFKWATQRSAPCVGDQFHLPEKTGLDRPLVAGAALFGVGWGLTGYCPGPALATLLSGNAETWWFVPAMLVGGGLQRWTSLQKSK